MDKTYSLTLDIVLPVRKGINEALAQAELLNPHHSQDPRAPRKMVIFTDNQAAI
jgi:hypothetical protein